MEKFSHLTGTVRFGLFEADLQTGELRKNGIKVKLQEQPFKVLAILLERPGKVVSREELQERVWGADTFVDFDHSLATAVNKVRQVLGDSPEAPRYVQTLARRGYRFIAPVAINETSDATTPDEPAPQLAQITSTGYMRKRQWWKSVLLLAGSLVLGSLLTVWVNGPEGRIRPTRIIEVTDSGKVYPGDLTLGSFPTLVVGASRIYFPEENAGSTALADTSTDGGETGFIPTPPELIGPSIADISKEGSSLLVRDHLAPEVDQALWVIPTLGGAARRVGNVLAHDATWSPDGQSILYAAGRSLFLAKADGSDSRRLTRLPGLAFWPRWSPDGKRLRFTVLNPSTRTMAIWEISADGTNLHQLLLGWRDPPDDCCGNWTPDGKYYVFQSTQDGRTNIWAQPQQKVGFFQFRRQKPLQLTAGPLNFLAPVPSWNGRKIFAVGVHSWSELLKYDPHSRLFEPWLSDISNISQVEFSRDGKWVAYIKGSDGSLWRSRPNGTAQLQLTSPPLQVYMMRWSPSDGWVVFMGKEPGEPWRLYLIPAMGGAAQPLLSESYNEGDPGWSPDGHFLVFGRLPSYMAEDSSSKQIYILNLQTKKVSTIPGSEDLFSPRWSPDGHYLAAITVDQRKLMLFDFKSQKWQQLVDGSVDNPVWSRDGLYIYFQAFMEKDEPIYCVGLRDHKLKKVTSFSQARVADVLDYSFSGLAPDGSPLACAHQSAADIYAIEWREP